MSISGTDLTNIISTYNSHNTKTASSTNSSLDMTDFIKLLVAQMTNQDVMNPTDNTEFVSQLAQYSTLQAMQDMEQKANLQYASSLVGKYVTVSQQNKTTGVITKGEGIVNAVSLSGASPLIVVNGTAYDMSAVTGIFDTGANANGDNTGTDANTSASASTDAGQDNN
mgnify:CR=1 FL=1